MWKQLSEENYQSLYKCAAGQHTVEVVDEFLTPMVIVSSKEHKSETELETLGMYYADDACKFYDNDTGDEVASGDFNDRVIEAHLEAQAEFDGKITVDPDSEGTGPEATCEACGKKFRTKFDKDEAYCPACWKKGKGAE